ncbi:MAG: hypothetical protein ABFD96_25020 [Armatimonadia bacterium]
MQMTAQIVTSIQRLAGELSRIVEEQPDYRQRVDAIARALRLEPDQGTATTALVIALASVPHKA